MNVEDKIVDSEKQLEQTDAPASNTKEGLEIANEQKEPEDKVYTEEVLNHLISLFYFSIDQSCLLYLPRLIFFFFNFCFCFFRS